MKKITIKTPAQLRQLIEAISKGPGNVVKFDSDDNNIDDVNFDANTIEWEHHEEGDEGGSYLASHGEVGVMIEFAAEYQAAGNVRFSVSDEGVFEAIDSDLTAYSDEGENAGLDVKLQELADVVADMLTRDYKQEVEDSLSNSAYDYRDSEAYDRDPYKYYGVKRSDF
jgi:hypothetical protein